MSKTARVKASTQQFTGIVDIVDNIVVLESGQACSVIEVTASNFALLSKKEQDSKIYSYAALLNSLSFPIQIVIRNQRVDITSYLKTLDDMGQNTKNELLSRHIKQYRDFIHQIIKVNIVLNKEFYIVISYSSLEQGVTGAASAAAFKKGSSAETAFIEDARKSLSSKSESLLAQLRRLAVAAKTLEKEELIKLYYNIYNQDILGLPQVADDIKSTMITTKT